MKGDLSKPWKLGDFWVGTFDEFFKLRRVKLVNLGDKKILEYFDPKTVYKDATAQAHGRLGFQIDSSHLPTNPLTRLEAT